MGTRSQLFARSPQCSRSPWRRRCSRRRIRPATDPRNGLKAGRARRRHGASGMRLVSFSPKPAQFDSVRGLTFINSDLAFRGTLRLPGQLRRLHDLGRAAIRRSRSSRRSSVHHVAGRSVDRRPPALHLRRGRRQSQRLRARAACKDTSTRTHMAGVRIFDVSNPRAPKLIKNVQTCKGSHTHTVVPSPTDKGIVYLYVSGSQGARPETELAGCKNGTDPADATNSLYPSRRHQGAARSSRAVRRSSRARASSPGSMPAAEFCVPAPPAPVAAAARGGRRGGAGAAQAGTPGAAPAPDPTPTGPRNCHDVTSYPAMHLLAAACSSYGLLVDISNPEKPVRLDAQADTNFSLLAHGRCSATTARRSSFTDEWGGGTAPMCQATSMMEMGGNTVLTIAQREEVDAARVLQDSDGAERRRRTACRTTADSFRCRGATSWCRAGTRAAST